MTKSSRPPPSSVTFRGVRKRQWGKWVAEIRQPRTRSRLWLGSYFSQEAAARAFDAAAFLLRRQSASLNLPHLLPPSILQLPSLSPKSVQRMAIATGSLADAAISATSNATISAPAKVYSDTDRSISHSAATSQNNSSASASIERSPVLDSGEGHHCSSLTDVAMAESPTADIASGSRSRRDGSIYTVEVEGSNGCLTDNSYTMFGTDSHQISGESSDQYCKYGRPSDQLNSATSATSADKSIMRCAEDLMPPESSPNHINRRVISQGSSPLLAEERAAPPEVLMRRRKRSVQTLETRAGGGPGDLAAEVGGADTRPPYGGGESKDLMSEFTEVSPKPTIEQIANAMLLESPVPLIPDTENNDEHYSQQSMSLWHYND